MEQPTPDDDTRDEKAGVVVLVVRSGGVAGVTRRWRAAPPPEDTPRWVTLIDECPWDDASRSRAGAQPGADRYVWRIEASTAGEEPERRADVPDSRLDGAWRVLVDEVRGAASASR